MTRRIISCEHKGARMYLSIVQGDDKDNGLEIHLCQPCTIAVIAHSMNSYNHFDKETKSGIHEVIKSNTIMVDPDYGVTK